MNDQAIRDRIFGRSLADECLGLAREQFPGASEAMLTAFWEEAAKSAKEALEALGVAPEPSGPRLVPMTDQEARAFETTRLPFGKHVGRTVGDVLADDQGPSYLDWLVQASEADRFKEDLRRFLANAGGVAGVILTGGFR